MVVSNIMQSFTLTQPYSYVFVVEGREDLTRRPTADDNASCAPFLVRQNFPTPDTCQR
jgi:hypothetical protein